MTVIPIGALIRFSGAAMRRARSGALAAVLAAAACAVQAGPSVPRDSLTLEPIRLSVLLDDGQALALEALVVKPSISGRLPLALITHGSPREAAARRRMSAAQMSFQAEELARRGYVAVVVMRRGYGASDGVWAESSGRCDAADHERAARESARDLRAALRSLAAWPMVDAAHTIVIGQSAGGIGTMALAADPPPGLRAAINFAGGRGSRGPNDVCSEDRLVNAYAALGKTARVPSLWIYTENDTYFGPDLARRMFTAYSSQGGVGDFRLLPAFAEDGHRLFASRGGVAHWRPLLDEFLRRNGLPTWDAPPTELPVAELPPPAELAPRYHAQWQQYLDAPDNKAFALSPNGRFAWRSGFYRVESARSAALAACGLPSCRLVSENDILTSN